MSVARTDACNQPEDLSADVLTSMVIGPPYSASAGRIQTTLCGFTFKGKVVSDKEKAALGC